MVWFQQNLLCLLLCLCVSVNERRMADGWKVKHLFSWLECTQDCFKSVSVHRFVSSRSSRFFFTKNGGVKQSTNSMNDDISIVELLLKFFGIEDTTNEPVHFIVFRIVIFGPASEGVIQTVTDTRFGHELGLGLNGRRNSCRCSHYHRHRRLFYLPMTFGFLYKSD
jgi:hypothetical protein